MLKWAALMGGGAGDLLDQALMSVSISVCIFRTCTIGLSESMAPLG